MTKRVLICGDSFFHAATRNLFRGLHWSQRLPDHIDVTNVARGGSSNTMILDQFVEHFDGHDAVIFGFTGPWRLEFAFQPDFVHDKYFQNKWLTSCFTARLNDQQRQLDRDYMKLVNHDAVIVRECGLMIAAIEMARKVSKVYYSLSGGKKWMQDFSNDYPKNRQIVEYINNDMPFSLYDYFMSAEYDQYRHLDGTDSHPPFHVHLPEIQQRFADQVRDFVDNA